MTTLPCPHCDRELAVLDYFAHVHSCPRRTSLRKFVLPYAGRPAFEANIGPMIINNVITKIRRESLAVRNGFPDAVFSNSCQHMLLTFPLTSQFNRQRTKMLIRLYEKNPAELSYKEPDVYVESDVDLRHGHSDHLDFGTEWEMREKGWKKICKLASGWNQNSSLTDFMVMVTEFFGGLRD